MIIIIALLTLQTQLVSTINKYFINITNPVNLTNLAPHVDHIDHADLYILKEPLLQSCLYTANPETYTPQCPLCLSHTHDTVVKYQHKKTLLVCEKSL